MTDTLPWNDDGVPAITTGADLHARATDLAVAAMRAAETMPTQGPNGYQESQAHWQLRLAEMRAESSARHVAANNERARAAAEAKAERQAAHEARNASAAADKRARKAA